MRPANRHPQLETGQGTMTDKAKAARALLEKVVSNMPIDDLRGYLTSLEKDHDALSNALATCERKIAYVQKKIKERE